MIENERRFRRSIPAEPSRGLTLLLGGVLGALGGAVVLGFELATLGWMGVGVQQALSRSPEMRQVLTYQTLGRCIGSCLSLARSLVFCYIYIYISGLGTRGIPVSERL